ncbi:MAG: hypothetical protein ACE360_05295 [Hyphomicrobiales bacterium]
MNVPLLFTASALAGLTAAAHIFIGGKKNARPVLTAEGIPNVPRVTVAFAWHAASVFLISVCLAYLLAALGFVGQPLVIFMTVHCVALTFLSGAIALRGGITPFAFPPATLFALISVAGAAGLVAR